jgi:hypothetical protein
LGLQDLLLQEHHAVLPVTEGLGRNQLLFVAVVVLLAPPSPLRVARPHVELLVGLLLPAELVVLLQLRPASRLGLKFRIDCGFAGLRSVEIFLVKNKVFVDEFDDFIEMFVLKPFL